ncbi:hypothetical protein JMUB6875_64230 [Nocardia sp. JMUB6875]|uniref:hypothetical protein n=1 Tax=Nocardia sp. JMUB6875 TaxID=3158170 RepID=UPI0032E5526F
MTNPLVAGNPLTGLPLVGSVIGWLDKYLLDLRFPLGSAEAIELLVLIVVLFIVLTSVVGRLIPWLATRLLESSGRWITVVPAVLLAPEWLVTRFLGRLGRPPGRFVYSYGDGVLALADCILVVMTAVLRMIRSGAKASRTIAAVLLVLGFLLWNSRTCVGDTAPCVSPAQQWVQVAGHPKEP